MRINQEARLALSVAIFGVFAVTAALKVFFLASVVEQISASTNAPKAAQRLERLEQRLAAGTVTISPASDTKVIRLALRQTASNFREQKNPPGFFTTITRYELYTVVLVWVVQLAIALISLFRKPMTPN